MNEIHISLETVTPLLLHGTDPGAKPELRPPAFRGSLRYWFRAAAGGVIGDENLEGLHKMERAVFGSAEHGSPISLQIRGDLSDHEIDVPILPQKAKRHAFDNNQKFTLVIRQRPSGVPAFDDLIELNACMCFNLAILFGGVGLRARRGYGSLKVITSDSKRIFKTPASQENWLNHISRTTRLAIESGRRLAQNLDIKTTSLPASPTEYPCASTGGLVWFPAQPQCATPEDALKSLMSKMPKDPAFGGISPRQSSPLWARVIQVDSQYRLLFCLLPSISGDDKIRKFLETNFPGERIPVEGWNQ